MVWSRLQAPTPPAMVWSPGAWALIPRAACHTAYIYIYIYMRVYAYICVHMHVYACICAYICVYACICAYMVCVCVYMRVYACTCVVYAAKGGQEAGKGRKLPTFQNDENPNLKNPKMYSYSLFGWGRDFLEFEWL